MLVSIVVPVYNEEEALPAFHRSLIEVLTTLPHQFEVWYVAGGSTDHTSELVRKWHQADPRAKLLELSRNYGHQQALTAGLDYARGDVVISMDGDGQHPPALIPDLLAAYDTGYDVVLTQRRTTEQIHFFTLLFSKMFYQLINRLSASDIVPDSADFRLLSREVVEDLRSLREQHRFLRGMVSWMGFQQTIIPFDAPPRLGGRTKYSLRKRFRLAVEAIFSFSIVPINLAIVMGFILLFLAATQIFFVVISLLAQGRNNFPPGWISLMLAILVIGGTQMLTLGVIGYYVGMTFQESKRRPIYFVNKRLSTLKEQNTEIASQHESEQ